MRTTHYGGSGSILAMLSISTGPNVLAEMNGQAADNLCKNTESNPQNLKNQKQTYYLFDYFHWSSFHCFVRQFLRYIKMCT